MEKTCAVSFFKKIPGVSAGPKMKLLSFDKNPDY